MLALLAAVADRGLCSSSRTKRATVPSGVSSFPPSTRELLGSPALPRTSTLIPGERRSIVTLQRRPRQMMPAIVACDGCDFAVTVTTGTTHSWGLRPPCSYSLPDMKQHIPGATANSADESQRHGTRGIPSVRAPGFRRAQRPFRTPVVRCSGSSAFGRPPGNRSQPWSVTTTTRRQPLRSRLSIRKTIRRSSISKLRARVPAPSWPRESSAPNSVHAQPAGSPDSASESTCTPLPSIVLRSTAAVILDPDELRTGSSPVADSPEKELATGEIAGFPVRVTVGRAASPEDTAHSAPRASKDSVRRIATSYRRPSVKSTQVPPVISGAGVATYAEGSDAKATWNAVDPASIQGR